MYPRIESKRKQKKQQQTTMIRPETVSVREMSNCQKRGCFFVGEGLPLKTDKRKNEPKVG